MLVLDRTFSERKPQHTRQCSANLGDDQILGELGESDDVIKQLLLPTVVVRPLDQLEGITHLEHLLIASFVPVRLANDFGGICEKRRISSPSAIPDICVKQSPRSAIVSRIVRFCVTVFTTSRTAIFSGPDKVVRFWMEMEYSLAEGVWQSRSLSRVPRSAGIRRVEEPLAGSDSVCAVRRVFVVIECQEGFLGIVLDPTVTFVARLPQRVVGQADKDGLDSSQRRDPATCEC